MGKRLGDMLCNAVISYLLLEEATKSPHKRIVAKKFIRDAAIRTSAHYTAITSGNDLVLREHKSLLAADLPKE